MNNILSKYKALSFVMLAFAFASCNDFLDKNPDDRTEINTLEEVQKLLVYAYPNRTISYLTEFSSDNVTDNGKSHKLYSSQDKIYRFKDDTEMSNDDPKSVWEQHYKTIAIANAALDAIAKLGEDEKSRPLKAEALLCRAYSVFSLTNCFCMAYDSLTANQYLGIPYPKVSNISVDTRGTLAETYANINADIEAALPLVNDSYLKEAKAYHFNHRAAYAFAARFNLYYQKWNKAKKYASEALGNDPTSVMRTSVSTYGTMGAEGIKLAYINSDDPANFLLIPKYSIMGRVCIYPSFERFSHNRIIGTKETMRAKMPWSMSDGSDNNTLYESKLLFGDQYQDRLPFVDEFFETKDQVNRTGYAHIVEAAFTGDETTLVRAEANIMLGNLDDAIVDLNNYVLVHCAPSDGAMKRPILDVKNLKTFWKETKEYEFGNEDTNNPNSPIIVKNRSPKKLVNSRFTLTEDQTALLYTVLQMRRIETWWKGMRFQDIKRWGIEFVHELDGEPAIVFKKNDLRGAIQLPYDVITSGGLEKNPR